MKRSLVALALLLSVAVILSAQAPKEPRASAEGIRVPTDRGEMLEVKAQDNGLLRFTLTGRSGEKVEATVQPSRELLGQVVQDFPDHAPNPCEKTETAFAACEKLVAGLEKALEECQKKK
jgi:hypothetical protein